jgi:hypothetical protein
MQSTSLMPKAESDWGSDLLKGGSDAMRVAAHQIRTAIAPFAVRMPPDLAFSFYGDAFLARLAIGGVSRSSIKSRNPAAYTIEPDLNNADVYRRRYATFLDLYPRIRDLMVDLDV